MTPAARTALGCRAPTPRRSGTTRWAGRATRGRLRPAIDHADLDQEVLGRLLSILDEHVEVAIPLEDTRIQEFVLHVATGAPFVRLNEVGVVRKGRLGILVQLLHVRMGRRAIEVEVVLFDVLAVVAFAVGQAEQSLLEYWILAVPQTHAEAEHLFSSLIPAIPSSPQ